ncbi:hypothetical protein V9T40_006528 [Parthenolecanium corni]|uniref:Uncharacterized protein n=1 Tax=Parthenolecanium corni TaxID=536013 RepID=A0AAN9Y7H8_9HEMI
MVLYILRWAYRKYKIYCFIAFILLAISVVGYAALIVYWLRNLMQATKMRKTLPPVPPPEKLTASPVRRRDTEPSDEEVEHKSRPTRKVRVTKSKFSRRPPLQQADDSFTPSPLNQRAIQRKRRRRRRRRYSSRSDFDEEWFADQNIPNPRQRRLKMPKPGTTTKSPRKRGARDLQKEEKAKFKQFLFV